MSVLHRRAQHDIAQLSDQSVVVVRIKTVPRANLAIAGALIIWIARIGVSTPWARQLFGVIAHIEIVDVHLERSLIDSGGRVEVIGDPCIEGGEIVQLAPIQVLEIEVLIAHLLVIANLNGVDLGTATKRLTVALALFMRGDRRKGEGTDVPLGTNSEEPLVLLIETDESCTRQG